MEKVFKVVPKSATYKYVEKTFTKSDVQSTASTRKAISTLELSDPEGMKVALTAWAPKGVSVIQIGCVLTAEQGPTRRAHLSF